VDVLGLLADDERLRVIASLVLGARTTDEIAERTALSSRRVLSALTRLEAGGLVSRGDDALWSFELARLQEIARASRPVEEPDDVGDVDAATASVLRVFLRGGRLTQIPMHLGKRRIVLDHVCRVFDVGVRYPEREVNALLRAFHPDYAALRRYLVDDGFLSRERNIYWRTGGTVDL